MARKQERLTRNDIAKAARNAVGAPATMTHPSDAGPMSSQITEPIRSRTAVGPPMYTRASALLNLEAPHDTGVRC